MCGAAGERKADNASTHDGAAAADDDDASSSAGSSVVAGVDFDEDEEEAGGGGAGGKKGKGRGPKTANEVDEAKEAEAAEAEEDEGDGAVGEGEEVVPCGSILAVMGEGAAGTGTVVVQSEVGGGQQPLDEGSYLCLVLPEGRRVVLGRVGEVFGPIARPCYVVRPRKALREPVATEEAGDGDKEGDKKGPGPGPPLLQVGVAVGYIKGRAGFVVPQALVSKGTDASNMHDEELAPDGACVRACVHGLVVMADAHDVLMVWTVPLISVLPFSPFIHRARVLGRRGGGRRQGRPEARQAAAAGAGAAAGGRGWRGHSLR